MSNYLNTQMLALVGLLYFTLPNCLCLIKMFNSKGQKIKKERDKDISLVGWLTNQQIFIKLLSAWQCANREYGNIDLVLFAFC